MSNSKDLALVCKSLFEIKSTLSRKLDYSIETIFNILCSEKELKDVPQDELRSLQYCLQNLVSSRLDLFKQLDVYSNMAIGEDHLLQLCKNLLNEIQE